MAEDTKPPIVVKRIKKSRGGHHGGAWKIAYADFVTAMMAFFLLMWLLGSTTKGEQQGIADYFQTPLRVALGGGTGSGDSSSVLSGGGTDLTRAAGQVKKGEKPPERKTINLQAAKAELERQESGRLNELKKRLDSAIDASASLRPYRQQIQVDITPDGLRVQIVDEQSRPMFDVGSATLRDYTREILRELGKLMNDVPNRISLQGHTDAKPYAGGERGYSNWELSADRANASRRELIAGGIAENKIICVEGLGAAVMADKTDPFNPINRRISITVLKRKAEQRILGEHDVALAGTAEEVATAAGSSPPIEPPPAPHQTVK
jgi:chemotaxis protein MotB